MLFSTKLTQLARIEIHDNSKHFALRDADLPGGCHGRDGTKSTTSDDQQSSSGGTADAGHLEFHCQDISSLHPNVLATCIVVDKAKV